MARKSPHEHLKSTVFELLAQGNTVSEVRQVLPAIAKSTIYDWEKEYRLTKTLISGKESTDSGNVSELGSKPATVTVVVDNVEPLSPVDCNDIKEELRQVRRWLWRRMKSPEREDGVSFQGANAYLRAIQIEMGLDDGSEELTESERTDRIAQILDAARARRTG